MSVLPTCPRSARGGGRANRHRRASRQPLVLHGLDAGHNVRVQRRTRRRDVAASERWRGGRRCRTPRLGGARRRRRAGHRCRGGGRRRSSHRHARRRRGASGGVVEERSREVARLRQGANGGRDRRWRCRRRACSLRGSLRWPPPQPSRSPCAAAGPAGDHHAAAEHHYEPRTRGAARRGALRRVPIALEQRAPLATLPGRRCRRTQHAVPREA